MRGPNIKTLLLLLPLLLFALASESPAETHKRDTWYIGFGLGGALDATYTSNGRDTSFGDWIAGADEKNPRSAINFKVGTTFDPKTLIGFDLTAVGQSGKSGGRDVNIQINNYFLMLTHFPASEGLFVRGGGGFSNLVRDDAAGRDITKGYGLLAGIGYAFWLGKGFNLTLNLDHSRQYYRASGGDPDRSRFTTLYVGFDWY